MKPNFLIIGAARSGTTSLFQYLESHPNVFMSEVKELNFFSNEKYWVKGFHWYEKRFEKACVDAVGEASTSYSRSPFNEKTAERIFNYNRTMKLIYVMRDPIDRFMSHYYHNVNRGSEDRKPEDVIRDYINEPIFWQGCYFHQISQFLKYFPPELMHLMTIQDLKNSPEFSVRAVYDFLGVDPDHAVPFINKRHNASPIVTKKTYFGRLIFKLYKAYVEQKEYPYRFKKLFFNIAKLGATKVNIEPLSDELREILRLAYLAEVKKLQETYEIDVSEWKNFN